MIRLTELGDETSVLNFICINFEVTTSVRSYLQF